MTAKRLLLVAFRQRQAGLHLKKQGQKVASPIPYSYFKLRIQTQMLQPSHVLFWGQLFLTNFHDAHTSKHGGQR